MRKKDMTRTVKWAGKRSLIKLLATALSISCMLTAGVFPTAAQEQEEAQETAEDLSALLGEWECVYEDRDGESSQSGYLDSCMFLPLGIFQDLQKFLTNTENSIGSLEDNDCSYSISGNVITLTHSANILRSSSISDIFELEILDKKTLKQIKKRYNSRHVGMKFDDLYDNYPISPGKDYVLKRTISYITPTENRLSSGTNHELFRYYIRSTDQTHFYKKYFYGNTFGVNGHTITFDEDGDFTIDEGVSWGYIFPGYLLHKKSFRIFYEKKRNEKLETMTDKFYGYVYTLKGGTWDSTYYEDEKHPEEPLTFTYINKAYDGKAGVN